MWSKTFHINGTGNVLLKINRSELVELPKRVCIIIIIIFMSMDVDRETKWMNEEKKEVRQCCC